MNKRYEILALLAEGGQGTVFKARDTQTGRDVALKRISASNTGNSAPTADALIREAQQQALVQHPNIVAVYDFGADAIGAFVVLELVPGENLEDLLQRSALTAPDFDALARQSLAGLRAVHAQGILHLDLKPGNLMLQRLPEGGLRVKLLDFGLAQTALETGALKVPPGSGLHGSVYFMAPEQFEGTAVDARTDLYALGCVLYYALTQHYPFGGETKPQVMVAHLHHRTQPLAALRPDLPAPTVQWVEWLISRSPANRPTSADEALCAYETGTAGSSAEAATAS